MLPGGRPACSFLLELGVPGDLHATGERDRHGTVLLVPLERTLRFRALPRGDLDVVFDPDTGDGDRAVDLLDVALDLGGQLVRMTRNLARLQRASQGSGQSTAGGRDHVVERGRQRLRGLGPVEVGDGAVHAELHGLVVERLDISVTQWTLEFLDSDVGAIDGF